jgi:hypothetical protein
MRSRDSLTSTTTKDIITQSTQHHPSDVNNVLRCNNYYLDVAKVLRDEASASSIFPNPVDKGASREKVYAEFLKQHAPSKCNVFFGGFVFDDNGNESKQLDIIITTDTTPRYNLKNKDGDGKSFSPIEGTLGIVSIKSKLDKKEIHDCLQGMASIPPMSKLDGRVNPLLKITGYDELYPKVVFD